MPSSSTLWLPLPFIESPPPSSNSDLTEMLSPLSLLLSYHHRPPSPKHTHSHPPPPASRARGSAPPSSWAPSPPALRVGRRRRSAQPAPRPALSPARGRLPPSCGAPARGSARCQPCQGAGRCVRPRSDGTKRAAPRSRPAPRASRDPRSSCPGARPCSRVVTLEQCPRPGDRHLRPLGDPSRRAPWNRELLRRTAATGSDSRVAGREAGNSGSCSPDSYRRLLGCALAIKNPSSPEGWVRREESWARRCKSAAGAKIEIKEAFLSRTALVC